MTQNWYNFHFKDILHLNIWYLYIYLHSQFLQNLYSLWNENIQVLSKLYQDKQKPKWTQDLRSSCNSRSPGLLLGKDGDESCLYLRAVCTHTKCKAYVDDSWMLRNQFQPSLTWMLTPKWKLSKHNLEPHLCNVGYSQKINLWKHIALINLNYWKLAQQYNTDAVFFLLLYELGPWRVFWWVPSQNTVLLCSSIWWPPTIKLWSLS